MITIIVYKKKIKIEHLRREIILNISKIKFFRLIELSIKGNEKNLTIC